MQRSWLRLGNYLQALVLTAVSISISGCSDKVGETPPYRSSQEGDNGKNIASSERDRRKDEDRRNGFLQICMKDKGFVYIPFIPEFDTKNDDLPDSQEEAVERWGFQISLAIEERFSGKGFGIAKLVKEDPNSAITANLAKEEQVAYQKALIECSQKGNDSFGYPPGIGAVSEESEQFEEELLAAVEKDPRVVSANRSWRTCMVNQGFKVSDRFQLMASIEKKAAPFIEKYSAAVDTELQSYRESGGDRWPGSELRTADVLSPAELTELAKLQQYEFDAARADLDCYAGPNEVIAKVTNEKSTELQRD